MGEHVIEYVQSYLTRQDIMNFPFPYKIWICINLETCDCIYWNRDGTVLLLDLVALETYLNSPKSIFNIKNCSNFLQILKEFKFQRLNAMPEAAEDLVLQFSNANFQRHRLDLIPKIRKSQNQILDKINDKKASNVEKKIKSDDASNVLAKQRMLSDLCFLEYGSLSQIQASRIRFQTVLNFENEKKILQKKIQITQERNKIIRQRHTNRTAAGGMIAGAAVIDEDVIELPVDLFENPHDSVLKLNSCDDYAGYYGNCNNNQIQHFFGDYLPKYENDSKQVKKLDVNKNDCATTFANSNISSSFGSKSLIVASTPMASKLSANNFNISAALEPIYNNNDEEMYFTHSGDDQQISVIQNPIENDIDDDEISMDEFIKFKDSSSSGGCWNVKETEETVNQIETPHCSTSWNDNATGGNSFDNDDKENCCNNAENLQTTKFKFPQMPKSIKKQIEHDEKNEENFSNFFKQYRATLNLLYDN